MQKAVLQTEGLSKHFGSTKALQGVDLTVGEGQTFGILGPNGSGKSTFLGIVLGVLFQHSGSYKWGDVSGNFKGALLEEPRFYPSLSAFRNLQISAEIKGVAKEDIHRVLHKVELQGKENVPYNHFSTGMKQRLGIANTLLGDPPVLVLDEPTNGLDPAGIAYIRNLILDEQKRGKTIILASHLLDEVEKVCTHTAVFQGGKILAMGRVNELLSPYKKIQVAAADMQKLESVAASFSTLNKTDKNDAYIEWQAARDFDTAAFSKHLYEHGVVPTHLLVRDQSLEEQFLKLTENDQKTD